MYGKIFRQIYNSSIANNWKTRVVFMDMIVMADSDGVVDMTPESIAATTRYPIEMVKEAIAELEAPDPESRTCLQEGKRIIRLDNKRSWGWQIVNYNVYRSLHCEFDRKTYLRNYMRSYRKRNKKASVNTVNKKVLSVNNSPYSYSSSYEVPKGGTGGNGIIQFRLRVGELYNRKPEDRWSYEEERNLFEVHKRPSHDSELSELCDYRKRIETKFFPNSVLSLLEKWSSTLDRARTKNQPTKEEAAAAEKAISMFVPPIPRSMRDESHY